MTCLGIITARGGSKGIPRKNLRRVGHRTLIERSIAVGLASSDVDVVMVTTDSDEIKDAAVRAGAEVPFLRPSELATDTARQEDAILHAMQWYESQNARFDSICLLEPTAPLRTVESLRKGFRLLRENQSAEAVFSVTPAETSPIWMNTLREDGTLKDFVDERYLWANRQEVPTYYKLTPVVTMSRWDAFKERETFLHDSTLSLIVDPIEGLDVDGPLELFLIQQLVEHGITNSGDLEAYIADGH